ncbi:MAG: hypothetical protein COB67_03195 [SAR324 cluster bacterium]|uniref:DUF4440 domain-containing protein n=1 Tax=SAR324 cluster bacterium TaxID=2024889 RepID=A0A2A4T9F4_9DELT|nr:MAG: hypothetical protein COB67_03195 [SAR324 cluster bacterium]
MIEENLRTEILELEKKLILAEKNSDQDSLSQLILDDFTGILVNGSKISKSEFIAAFCSSDLHFVSLEIENLDIRRSGETVTVVGRSIFTVEVSGNQMNGSAKFLDNWTRENGSWGLSSSSVTPDK